MTDFTPDDKTMLKRHDEILRGNGELGLRAQVKQNTDDLSDIKDNTRWLARLMFGVLVLQIVSIAMS